MNDKFILGEDGSPMPEPDVLRWGKWMQENERHLALDNLPNGVRVSTVFLGLDHSFGGGKPVLWETMIFNGPHDQYQERYSSVEDAKEGHLRALELAKGSTQ